MKKRPKQEQVQKRQGKRAAYQVGAFYLELTLTTPRHGDRLFEIAPILITLNWILNWFVLTLDAIWAGLGQPS